MRRREFVGFAGLAMALAAVRAGAQAKRVPRIGYLVLTSLTAVPSPERAAFIEGLAALGYVPGKSIEIIYRSAESEPEFLDESARELVAIGVDVLATAGAGSTMAAKRATTRIPIVMLAIGDPVGIGAVKSIARPGGNITGMSFISSDLAPKRVELVKELMPRAKRVTIAWDARNSNAREESTATQVAVRALGMAPEMTPIGSESELASAFKSIAAQKPDVLYLSFEGGLVASSRTQFAEFALRQRLALVSGWSGVPEAGGLLSYAPDLPDMFRRAATFVHRILRGERAAEMPIELPTRIELVINARTARVLGLKISQSLLVRADRVIE